MDASKSDSSTPPTTPRITPASPPQRPVVDGIKSRHPRMSSYRSTLSDGEGIGGPADLEEVPIGVKRQALQLEKYAFPDHRLRQVMEGVSC